MSKCLKTMRRLSSLLLLSTAVALLGCGGGSGMSQNGAGGQAGAAVPQFDHVVVVVAENQSFENVIGNSAMPFFNSLASKYGLATNYFADVHPSLPNYFMLTVGATIAPDDSFTGTVSQDNIVNALTKAGKTWRCYADSIPNAGYLGGDVGLYARHHNPFTYFSDVINDPKQAGNIMPVEQLASDLGNQQLPNYSFILPNEVHNGHDCANGGTCANNDKLAMIDGWLQSEIQPVLDNPEFQNSGLLIITFDEGDQSDMNHGGGHVATLLISSKAKSGFKSTTFFQHESVLGLVMNALRVSDLPGASANAPAMGEFFQ